jgi:hypothetical protein
VGAADQAFVSAMGTATSIGALVALLGAVIALAFLPARSRPAPESTDDQVEDVEVREEVLEPALV